MIQFRSPTAIELEPVIETAAPAIPRSIAMNKKSSAPPTIKLPRTANRLSLSCSYTLPSRPNITSATTPPYAKSAQKFRQMYTGGSNSVQQAFPTTMRVPSKAMHRTAQITRAVLDRPPSAAPIRDTMRIPDKFATTPAV